MHQAITATLIKTILWI